MRYYLQRLVVAARAAVLGGDPVRAPFSLALVGWHGLARTAWLALLGEAALPAAASGRRISVARYPPGGPARGSLWRIEKVLWPYRAGAGAARKRAAAFGTLAWQALALALYDPLPS